MTLSDTAILEAMEAGKIIIDPFDQALLGPNSYDVHLGDEIGELVTPVESPLVESEVCMHKIDPGNGFLLQPLRPYLASTREYTETHDLFPRLEGRSSVARKALMVHITAGSGDAGFSGPWTLEMVSFVPFRVYPGMPIGQLIFSTIQGKVAQPYSGKRGTYNTMHPGPVKSNLHKKDYWRKFYGV